eukprot:3178178-Pleurochrysis_carterae.AAC.1
MSRGAQGRARCLALWPGWLRRHREASHQAPGHDFYGKKMECHPEDKMQSASVAMSTLRRSETGPSSSTFQRDKSAVVRDEYKE